MWCYVPPPAQSFEFKFVGIRYVAVVIVTCVVEKYHYLLFLDLCNTLKLKNNASTMFLHTTVRLPNAANVVAHHAADMYRRNDVDSDDSGEDSDDSEEDEEAEDVGPWAM